jgi:hypothetical protein
MTFKLSSALMVQTDTRSPRSYRTGYLPLTTPPRLALIALLAVPLSHCRIVPRPPVGTEAGTLSASQTTKTHKKAPMNLLLGCFNPGICKGRQIRRTNISPHHDQG